MARPDRATTARDGRSDAVPVLIVSDGDELVGRLLDALTDGPAQARVVTSVAASLRDATALQPGVVVVTAVLASDRAIELAAAFKRLRSSPRVVMLDRLASLAAAVTDPDAPIDDVIPAATDAALLVHRVRAAIQQHLQDADRRDRLKEMLLLEELSRLGSADVDLHAALTWVTRRLVDLTGIDVAAIGEHATSRVFSATRDQPDGAVGCNAADLAVLVLDVGTSRGDGATGVDPILLGSGPSGAAQRLGLRVVLPLTLTLDAEPWGVLLVGRRDAKAFTRRQTARLEQIAHLVGALIERSARRAEIRSRDSLVHDLMQPVTAAMAMLEMLVADESLSPTGQVLAESMQRALSRVGRATSSGHPRSSRTADTIAAVDLRRAIADAAGLVEPAYARQGLTLVRRLAPDLPPVSGDAEGIERILVNLLVNAREAMIGRSGTVLLTAARVRTVAGEAVELRVRDQGPGIAPAIRDRLFEPYCSTKGQGRQRGLGLSSCREIVEHLGGSICAEPVDGEGACFRVVLPAARSLAAVGDSSANHEARVRRRSPKAPSSLAKRGRRRAPH